MPRQVAKLHKRQSHWACCFCEPFSGLHPADIEAHVRAEHADQNAWTDYEWPLDGEHHRHLDSTCFVKDAPDDLQPRSFVHSKFCHECAIQEHGAQALLSGQLSLQQLEEFELPESGEHGVCCACSASICERHMPPNLLYPIAKKQANKNNKDGLVVGESKSKERLFVCNECAHNSERLNSSSAIRYYQRRLAVIRRRPNFRVKAILSLREHAQSAERSIFAPRIKPIKHSNKCCECRFDLNPHQGKQCMRLHRGIEAYDRGQLLYDFARLPDSGFESPQEEIMLQDRRYDSDCSYDFEHELKTLNAVCSGSQACCTSDTKVSNTASVLNMAGNTSESEDFAEPPVVSSRPQQYITQTVPRRKTAERTSLQKLFDEQLGKFKTAVEYAAQVRSLIIEQAADKKALESANKQVLQLSADKAEATAKCALVQSVNERLEEQQERLQQSLEKVCTRLDCLEAARPSKKHKGNDLDVNLTPRMQDID